MSENRKLAAILVADVAGYSRLTGADEGGTLARLRTLRGELFTPTVTNHNGRVAKRTGDGAIVEFRSVVEAVRCAIEVQRGIAERNAGAPNDSRIDFRVGIHLGDVVEEADGDLMGDGVNVAARLEGICKPGGICLSEDAYRQVRDRVNETFVDLGDRNLKNIARPVRAYALEPTAGGRPAVSTANVAAKPSGRRLRAAALVAAIIAILKNVVRLVGAVAERTAPAGAAAVPSAGDAPQRARRARNRGLRWTIIAAAIIALVVARIWRGHEPVALPPPPAPPPAADVTAADDKLAHAPRLSIVVLPFANLSGDPEQDYFADGLTDDLTTDLTHLPDSFVIGRSTAAAYKSKPVDLKQLGRDLGVRYAVEGSVGRAGDTVTLNAQLVSTETGAHIWADRFEGDRSRLGALQVQAVSRIANALGVQLVQAESLRAIRERPANPDAADLVMRGLAAFDAGFTPENFTKAIGYFDQALRLDPDNWRALAGKAEAKIVGLMSVGLGKDRWLQVLDEAEAAVDRVLVAQPNYAHAHLTNGLIAKVRGQSDVWLAELNAAIASDRNFAAAYAEKSHYMITHGRSPEAFELVEEALRLDPHDVGRNIWEWYACNAHAHLAQWEQAIEWCQTSAASNPALFWPHFELAAAYASLGQLSDAAREVSELRKLRPDSTVQLYRVLQDFPDPTFVTERDRIMEGLRKAGLP